MMLLKPEHPELLPAIGAALGDKKQHKYYIWWFDW